MFELGEMVSWVVNTMREEYVMTGVILDDDTGQEFLKVVSHTKNGKPYNIRTMVERTKLHKI